MLSSCRVRGAAAPLDVGYQSGPCPEDILFAKRFSFSLRPSACVRQQSVLAGCASKIGHQRQVATLACGTFTATAGFAPNTSAAPSQEPRPPLRDWVRVNVILLRKYSQSRLALHAANATSAVNAGAIAYPSCLPIRRPPWPPSSRQSTHPRCSDFRAPLLAIKGFASIMSRASRKISCES